MRSDIADYYYEVQRWDREVGEALKILEKEGLLDNTIVVMTSDNGMPFPRCKGNLYDGGTRKPMAIRWGSELKPGTQVADFVSFTNLAPTFLELAGVDIPKEMTGKSLRPILQAKNSTSSVLANVRPSSSTTAWRIRPKPTTWQPSPSMPQPSSNSAANSSNNSSLVIICLGCVPMSKICVVYKRRGFAHSGRLRYSLRSFGVFMKNLILHPFSMILRPQNFSKSWATSLSVAVAASCLIAVPEPLLGKEEKISTETCLDCHSDPDLTVEREGKEVPMVMDADKFKASVHSDADCFDCHEGVTLDHPDDEKPVAKIDCGECHTDARDEFQQSIHGSTRKGGAEAPATCTSCHQDIHEMVPVKHLDSPVSKFNLPQTCGTCHEDQKAASKLGLENHDAIEHFRDSIHGQSLFKKGLIFAPSCNDCHGVHDILPGENPDSSTHRAKISNTCSKCHPGVQKIFDESVHGKLMKDGDPAAPVCIDCHTAHDIEQPSNAHFKAGSDQRCGKCHQDSLNMYHETYHGKAMALGEADVAQDVAACYDCHGHHDVLPISNPNSHLSKENIVNTCKKCHSESNDSFVQYQPHADPYDAEKYPVLNKAYWFMTSLLVCVFVFFGIHTLLWVTRAFIEYFRDPQAFKAARVSAHEDPETYRRFSSFERFLHILVASSFLVLVITGMPLKFYYTAWAKEMFHVLGGPASARTLHHIAALVTFLYFALHLGSLIKGMKLRKEVLYNPETGKFEMKRLWGWIFGPDSMVPSLQDVRDFTGHIKWFFGRGPKPQWDRWTYWERFDYFAVFWGVAIIGLSGLILWFPQFFSLFLPGWWINIAVVVHSDEALLAAGFIFSFHFFNTHFRIDRFPMDMVIFSGHISKTEMLQERRRWYDRLVASGKLDEHRVIHETWKKRRGYYRVLGFVFLGTGLALLALMIYALLSRLMH